VLAEGFVYELSMFVIRMYLRYYTFYSEQDCLTGCTFVVGMNNWHIIKHLMTDLQTSHHTSQSLTTMSSYHGSPHLAICNFSCYNVSLAAYTLLVRSTLSLKGSQTDTFCVVAGSFVKIMSRMFVLIVLT